MLKRNVLTVFLASPSDLKEERRLAEGAVERLNSIMGKELGWQVELVGWEGLLAGHGRPQGLINKHLASCDLFVGVLWKRWGEPTGKYSSGFEEEFRFASDRRTETGKPEIWLFFKAVNEDVAADPGQQLTRVLQFKDDITRRKELLFKEFTDPEQWGKLIYDDLIRFLLGMVRDEREAPAIEQAAQVEGVKATAPGGDTETLLRVHAQPKQVTDLFKRVGKQVVEGGLEAVQFKDRARLFLVASCWLSADTGELMGVHEANIAYRHRREWEISREEGKLLVRSLIGDEHDLRPGWYWLRNKSDEVVHKLLCDLAVADREAAVRRGAFSLLAGAGDGVNREVIEKGLSDDDDEVVLQAIRLVRTTGQGEDADLLLPLLDSGQWRVRDGAIAARIELLYSEDANVALSELVRYGADVPPLILTNAGPTQLPKELLRQALASARSSVRTFAARQLRRAKLLSKEMCDQLLNDPHADVRKEGLQGLSDLAEDIDTDVIRKHLPSAVADELIPLILRKRQPQELLSRLQWYDLDGDDAYRVLAVDHFGVLEPRIRSDLEEGFDGLRSEYRQRMQAQFGDVAQGLLQNRDELDEFVRATYVSAALAGLAKHGRADDVKFAREFLGTTPHGIADEEAIRLLVRFGDPSDAETLLQFAATAYGDRKQLAAEGALKLSPGPEGILPKMLASDDEQMVGAAADALFRLAGPDSVRLAKPLLNYKNHKTRRKALAVIARGSDKPTLEELLDEYVQRPSYYYNVVTWLDRYLFAPGRYGDVFRTELLGTAPQGAAQ